MPGDPSSRGDEDLVSQIEELKARMDRLMKGGTSTSNSALLTDKVNPAEPEPAADEPPISRPIQRTRVRDLIGPRDSEVVEVYPGANDVVEFPDDDPGSVPSNTDEEVPLEPVDGSLISVLDEDHSPRTEVTRFDELGDAIQQELARDESVPPVEAKKGPDLASRFGYATGEDHPDGDESSRQADEPADEEAMVETEIIEDYQEEAPEEAKAPVARTPSRAGRIAAVWVFTAILSGTIATLHFTGLI